MKVSGFDVHPEEPSDEGKREKKGRKESQVLDRGVRLEFEDTFECIFHRIDILVEDECFRVDFFELVLEILEVALHLFSEELFDPKFEDMHRLDLWFDHMFDRDDIALADHNRSDKRTSIFCLKEVSLESLQISVKFFYHPHHVVEHPLDDLIEDHTSVWYFFFRIEIFVLFLEFFDRACLKVSKSEDILF